MDGRPGKRLAVHTMTTKPWPLETAIEQYARAGVRGISVWKEALEGRRAHAAGEAIRRAGLAVVSTVRGGFFADPSGTERTRRIGQNRELIGLSAELGSPLLVLVCGAHPGQALAESRLQIRRGLEALLPLAEAAGLRLAVEPLHPMYADTRSAIVTLGQANDLCADFSHPLLGVAVDAYHLWWDPGLEGEIRRCGALGKLFAYHISDWRTPTEDLLEDRALMGEGCIDLGSLSAWVDAAGFSGFREAEIFSRRWWAADQEGYLGRIVLAYRSLFELEAAPLGEA